MTKKIFTVTLFLIAATFIKAQVLTSFPTEKDKFMKSLEQLMKASKSDVLIETYDAFGKNVKDGLISVSYTHLTLPTILRV